MNTDPLKRCFINLFLVFLTPLVFFTLAEFTIAIFMPQLEGIKPRPLYQRINALDGQHVPVPNYVGKMFKPDFGAVEIRTNALGMRDHREYEQKREGVFRVLALGDSFTWGFGVEYEQTYLRRLEVLLNDKQHPEKIEIMKAGIPAYQTPDALAYLKHFGLPLEPDLVMLGFIGEDMLFKPKAKDRAGSRKSSFTGIFRASSLREAEKKLRESSHLYQLLAGSISRGPLLKWYVQQTAKDSFLLRSYTPKWQERWQATEGNLKEMAAVLHSAKIPFAIVVIPQRIQIAMHQLKIQDDRFDVNKPAKLIQEFAANHGVAVLDLMPSFLKAAQSEELYFPVDGHPNARATRIMAEALNSWLRQFPTLKPILQSSAPGAF